MQPSRRAFLLAGRAPNDPWGRFCQRLTRIVKGRFVDLTPAAAAPGLARLQPAHSTDLHHALALCAEFHIRLLLDGGVATCPHPALLVDPSLLDKVTRLADGSLQADPGARVGDARSLSQGVCPGAADDWTIARWLAAPAPYAPTRLHESGLDSVEVLLSDRTMESFGPFGADSRRAALSISASRLVSDLFTWVSQPQVAAWRNHAHWPGRYRIDALLAQTPNLAHLLLGSSGALAWPDRIRLVPGQAATSPGEAIDECLPEFELAAADDLDFRVKARFDPAGLFGC